MTYIYISSTAEHNILRPLHAGRSAYPVMVNMDSAISRRISIQLSLLNIPLLTVPL